MGAEKEEKTSQKTNHVNTTAVKPSKDVSRGDHPSGPQRKDGGGGKYVQITQGLALSQKGMRASPSHRKGVEGKKLSTAEQGWKGEKKPLYQEVRKKKRTMPRS